MDDETLNPDVPVVEYAPTDSEQEANERVNAQYDAVFQASLEGGPVLNPDTLLPDDQPAPDDGTLVFPKAVIPPFVSHSQAIEELRVKREACPHAVNHQQYIREGQVCACEREYSAEVIAAARS